MNRIINNIVQQAASFVQNPFTTISSQNRKIAMIAVAVFGFSAACYFVIKRCNLLGKLKKIDNENNNKLPVKVSDGPAIKRPILTQPPQTKEEPKAPELPSPDMPKVTELPIVTKGFETKEEPKASELPSPEMPKGTELPILTQPSETKEEPKAPELPSPDMTKGTELPILTQPSETKEEPEASELLPKIESPPLEREVYKISTKSPRISFYVVNDDGHKEMDDDIKQLFEDGYEQGLAYDFSRVYPCSVLVKDDRMSVFMQKTAELVAPGGPAFSTPYVVVDADSNNITLGTIDKKSKTIQSFRQLSIPADKFELVNTGVEGCNKIAFGIVRFDIPFKQKI